MIVIKNKNLADILMFKLNKLDNEFTLEELSTIIELTINPVNINGDYTPMDLEALAYLTNLEELEILNISVNNNVLAHLLRLAQLKSIVFDRCQFENLTNLAQLNITKISFINSNLDYSFLATMTELNKITIINFEYFDLTYLLPLKKLNTIELSYTNINNVNLFEQLAYIENVYIDNNNIIDLSFLLNYSNLKEISICQKQYKDNENVIKLLMNNGVKIYDEKFLLYLGVE